MEVENAVGVTYYHSGCFCFEFVDPRARDNEPMLKFSVPVVDYGQRAVISKELERYLTNPKFICSEIFDLQRFFSESHSGLACHETTTEKEDQNEKLKSDENWKRDGNGQTKDGMSGREAKRESITTVSDLQDKASLKQKAECRNSQPQSQSYRTPRTATCYSSATISSRAKHMLDLSQTRVRNFDGEEKSDYLKEQSQDKPNGSSKQPVVNVNNISMNNSPQFVPLKFKYSQGSVGHGSLSNSLTSITLCDDYVDDECLENRKKTAISLDETNLCRKSPAISLDDVKLKTVSGESNANHSFTKHPRNEGDENNNYQTQNSCGDSAVVTVSAFRSKKVSANLEAETQGKISKRITSLSPRAAQKHVQLVLKRVCLLDGNIQERKTINQAQRMIQNRAKTTASSTRSASVTPRPSTSSMATLSLDGTVLNDQTSNRKANGEQQSIWIRRIHELILQRQDKFPFVPDW